MADVEAEGFTDALEAAGKEAAMQAARRWHSAASERLIEAGDELEYETFPVARAFLPPQWNAREQAAEFAVNHPAARYFEHGTAEHEVSGDPWLAFSWEEMADEEFGDTGQTFKERFEDTWPTVFFKEVTVSGISRIGYMEHGKQVASRFLQSMED